MFAREGLIALASTALAGLGIAALAAPAQADETVTVSGTLSLEDSSTLAWVTGGFTPAAVIGATVTVTVTADVDDESGEEFYLLADGLLTDITDPDEPRVCVGADVEASWCFLEQGDTHTYAVDSSANNQLVTVRFNNFPTTPLLPGGFYVSFPTSSGTGSMEVAGPGLHLQQFPMPATGTCDKAEPEGVNWSGVGSGGWGESWAQWMNDGEGGDVCTRALIYNASASAWEVD